MNKDDFDYLSQQFDNKVLDSGKKKGFYAYEYMSEFKNFKESFKAKKNYIVFWVVKKLVTKNLVMFLRFRKKMKYYHDLRWFAWLI